MSRFQLTQIKARIVRLHELTVNLGKEVVAQRDAEGLLLPLERRQYLDGLQSGVEGLDAGAGLQGPTPGVIPSAIPVTLFPP